MTRNLWILAMIVFIDMAGIGLIVPVMPSLIERLSGEGIAHAAEIGGWLLFAYAVMQFLFAPIIGGLSDRFGRRPVLLVTLALLGADYAIMAAAPTIGWLFVGRAMSGVMGASFAAANSCIADGIPRDRRGAAFGMLGAAGAAGFVLGPAIGGLAGQFGDRLPFIVAALLCAGGTIAGAAVFRETLPPTSRRPFDPTRANPLGNVRQMLRVPLVAWCLLAIFFMQLASQSQLAVWAYYGTAKFGWSPLTIGLTVALFGALLALMQGVAVGRAIARFGPVRTAIVSLAFAVPAFLVIAFAQSTAQVVAGMVIGSLPFLCFPALQQLMSERIDDNAQGELQGAIASTISLTSIAGPPLMTGIFAAFADPTGRYFPGAPFVLAAALMALAVSVLAFALPRYVPVQMQ